jgi:hypothetical protein
MGIRANRQIQTAVYFGSERTNTGLRVMVLATLKNTVFGMRLLEKPSGSLIGRSTAGIGLRHPIMRVANWTKWLAPSAPYDFAGC